MVEALVEVAKATVVEVTVTVVEAMVPPVGEAMATVVVVKAAVMSSGSSRSHHSWGS